jgi:hypothetical protein
MGPFSSGGVDGAVVPGDEDAALGDEMAGGGMGGFETVTKLYARVQLIMGRSFARPSKFLQCLSLRNSELYCGASGTFDLSVDFDVLRSTKAPSRADCLGKPSFRY